MEKQPKYETEKKIWSSHAFNKTREMQMTYQCIYNEQKKKEIYNLYLWLYIL